ncbi:MAG: cobalamin biosynthesis protein CobD, partial [Chloroflexaceae bacterium]|nr:cobalamin biosynthesis protein CobD [Chloroflexaceae bacterium]
MMMRGRADVLLLALALDWLVGEPPDTLHPVVWLGRLAAALEQRAPRGSPPRELLYGAGMAAACLGVAALPALLVTALPLPAPLCLLEATLLKTTFSWRTLHHAGERVRQPLVAGNLEEARAGLRGS